MTFQYLRRAMAAGFMLALLSPLAARANTPEQIFVQVSPSIVVVDTFDAKGKSIGQGSGAVIGAGQVITNFHVARKGKSLQVRQLGKTFKATMQYADPDRDLCQLRVPDLQAPPVVLGTASKLRVGQRVYAIGAPKGLELTLSEGLISSLRQYEGSQYIQTSAAISPGSSGGGLFDDQGRLVGITTFQFIEGQNLNFALPVDWIGQLPKRASIMKERTAKPPIPSFEKFLAQERKKARDWFDRTIPLIEKEDWQGLLTLSQQRVKSEPEFALAWVSLGNAYSGLQQYDRAIQAYREALRIQPEDASAWSSLGDVYKDLKQYDNAIKAYRDALRIQPEHFLAWHSLGIAYAHLQQYDQAIQAYREALRIQPFPLAWYNLGGAYALKGQRDKVLEIYQTLRKLDPAMAEQYFNAFILP